MCSTENKETRLGKTLGSVRATDKGRRNKREQKNTKPKNKHKDRKWDFKGSIICEFASSWTIGRKFAKYEQGGKGRKTKKNKERKENKEERGKGRR